MKDINSPPETNYNKCILEQNELIDNEMNEVLLM